MWKGSSIQGLPGRGGTTRSGESSLCGMVKTRLYHSSRSNESRYSGGGQLCRHIGGAFGALKRLAIEPQQTLRDYATVVERRMFEQQPQFPVTVTKQDVVHAWQRLLINEDKEAATFLMCLWCTAMRPSELLLIFLDDVNVDRTTGHASFVVRDGKSVKARHGPYVIFTEFAQARMSIISWITARKRQHKQRLFDAENKRSLYSRVVKALRERVEQAEIRSLRRSTLQHLSSQGVTDRTLLLFSNHATVAMLNRYLGWGLFNATQSKRMSQAAVHLL